MFNNFFSKIFLAAGLALFGLTLTGVAQTAPAPVAPNVAGSQKSSSLLWKIVAPDGKLAYLLGSIHIGAPDFYPLPNEIESAFTESRKLVVEINLNKVDAVAMQQLVIANGIYSGNDSLWTRLTPATTEKLKKFGTDYGLPAAALGKMKPWIVSLNVSTLPLIKNGYQQELGIDKHFLDAAAKNGKQIAEIESAELQIKLLSGMSEPQQIQYLEVLLKDVDKVKTEAQALISAYRAGDAKQLETIIMSDSSALSAEITKKIIDDRNPRMTETVAQCLKSDERCFVVVGAAHLIGVNGVVKALVTRGFKVEPVLVTNSKR